MPITADQVKQLRDMTGAGMMECKKALADTGGDLERAVDALRKRGAANAEKRSGRAAQEGRVDSYIHPGNRVGVLIEINCETDFVARTDEFGELVRNIAMQAAAAGAEYVRREEVPAERVGRERDVLAGAAELKGKPAAILDKIVTGKLDKFFAGVCLLEQAYIRDDKRTVADIVQEAATKTGENIVVRRFVRFRLGQD
ncbi:MAG: translation elongation factor Ts [Candidatus Eisenbacteria bacterium]|uniref:Elongation factor Ts n=1 Tax=Eiseniibacteriota bacterium TaxID=2212470 RepID=A0A9D6L7Z6_UNCEI|nr:translation elongation factor Ts [Candidatus Eisenbacteria bacterium]MBI3539295.1 translation elongation factor Ts [Candidatus Eisenbacteria bacterium]